METITQNPSFLRTTEKTENKNPDCRQTFLVYDVLPLLKFGLRLAVSKEPPI